MWHKSGHPERSVNMCQVGEKSQAQLLGLPYFFPHGGIAGAERGPVSAVWNLGINASANSVRRWLKMTATEVRLWGDHSGKCTELWVRGGLSDLAG